MIDLPKLFSLTSSSPSSSFFAAASSSLNLLYFQNRTFTKLLLLCKVHQIPLPTSGHSPTMNSGQWSYTHFTLASRADFITCSVERIFFGSFVERFYHNSLYRSPNLAILDTLERILDGTSEYPIFFYCTSLIMGRKLITTATFILRC